MTIEQQHPEFAAAMPKWGRMRVVMQGKDALMVAGETYLPKLSGQTDREYAAYLLRAPLYGATCRTHQALVGMVFSRPERLEWTGPQDIIDDVTMSGMGVRGFAEAVVWEQLAVGRVGVLVDFAGLTDETLTLGMAEASNRRPYARIYRAETIINWRVDGSGRLTMVVLSESIVEPQGEFGNAVVQQYRVLDLFEGDYRQRVFRKADSGEWVQMSEAFPLMNGAMLSEIPFVFVGTMNNDACPDEPPFLALADANLTHYRVCADYHNALHYLACPTPVITGHSTDDNQLKLGGAMALVFPQPDAKAYYLEFSGAGLGEVKQALDDLKAEMVTLGSAVLSSEGKQTETARVADLRRVGESATLQSMVRCASDGLTKVLGWLALWSGGRSGSIELNTDFDPALMEPQRLQALVAAWQSGAISGQTLFANLQRSHIIPNDVTYEDEQARVSDAAPRFAQGSEQGIAPSEGMMSRLQRLLGGL